MEARRRELLEKNEREMRSFFEKRESAERAFAERTAANERAYEEALEKRRADDAEEFGILKTRLETDVANLEQHLAHMRAVYQLNAEKLEYNYRVLVEREAENQSTSSQQRKKIAFAREKLMVLKRKHAEAEKAFSAENVKLAEEHRRGVETFKELQMKHKRFVRADTKKFEEVWAMHEELVAAKVRRVLDADRVIHEQQLGWRWRPPSDDVFLKPDDLALVEGRKKREAAAAAAAAAAAEAVANHETEADADDDASVSDAPAATKEADGNPSVADSEENPFSKRLGDPAYAELLEITAEACSFLVDPATSRALAEDFNSDDFSALEEASDALGGATNHEMRKQMEMLGQMVHRKVFKPIRREVEGRKDIEKRLSDRKKVRLDYDAYRRKQSQLMQSDPANAGGPVFCSSNASRRTSTKIVSPRFTPYVFSVPSSTSFLP